MSEAVKGQVAKVRDVGPAGVMGAGAGKAALRSAESSCIRLHRAVGTLRTGHVHRVSIYDLHILLYVNYTPGGGSLESSNAF